MAKKSSKKSAQFSSVFAQGVASQPVAEPVAEPAKAAEPAPIGTITIKAIEAILATTKAYGGATPQARHEVALGVGRVLGAPVTGTVKAPDPEKYGDWASYCAKQLGSTTPQQAAATPQPEVVPEPPANMVPPPPAQLVLSTNKTRRFAQYNPETKVVDTMLLVFTKGAWIRGKQRSGATYTPDYLRLRAQEAAMMLALLPA